MAQKNRSERKIEYELLWILGFFVVLVIIYLLAAAFFRSFTHFDYNGIEFTKEKYGEIPVFHHSYYFNNKAGKLIQYNLYLRTDPRENNVSVVGGPMVLQKRGIYFSLNDSYPQTCKDNLVAVITLTKFLTDNDFTVISGVTNSTYAQENDKKYITCGNQHVDSEVFVLQGGNQTGITVDKNCHTISIGPDCRVLEAIEKTEVQILLDTKEIRSKALSN